jgi:hypothetical protein
MMKNGKNVIASKEREREVRIFLLFANKVLCFEFQISIYECRKHFFTFPPKWRWESQRRKFKYRNVFIPKKKENDLKRKIYEIKWENLFSPTFALIPLIIFRKSIVSSLCLFNSRK